MKLIGLNTKFIVEEEDYKELDRYIKVGKDLRKSTEFVYFNHLINSIERGESPFDLENSKNLITSGVDF